MTLILHLGVMDVPYQENRITRVHKFGVVRLAPMSTGDVAEILEDKYGVMEAFFENKEEEIVGFLEASLAGALENLIAGAPPGNDPFGEGTSKIEESFKDFLSSKEAERIGIEGTPTEAARRGVNHRLKHPYAKANPRRPSFIDTGLYQSSMKAWVE